MDGGSGCLIGHGDFSFLGHFSVLSSKYVFFFKIVPNVYNLLEKNLRRIRKLFILRKPWAGESAVIMYIILINVGKKRDQYVKQHTASPCPGIYRRQLPAGAAVLRRRGNRQASGRG